MQFGLELPDYEAYPLGQIFYSDHLQAEFHSLMLSRQAEYKLSMMPLKGRNIFRTIARHTMNHYIDVDIK